MPQRYPQALGGPILAGLSLLNFAAFLAGATYLGGTARNGYEYEGRCFLGNDGALIKVDCGMFHYSLWHERTTLAALVLAYVIN